ncbi:7 transmembrane receptor [Oesophagostomum dentatum]|uniref:7 transmembrane receptor n=1 Tax=Oesophagostomum dentatum TaxID=61180 RepID=A0A0B1TCW2_OESDE|nr:7 transmembrane receptor [Oesophagostomum dentatum]
MWHPSRMNLSEEFRENVEVPEVYQLTPFFKVLCICFYNILCVSSVYGNFLVILVILYFRRLRTATNILILNLAIVTNALLEFISLKNLLFFSADLLIAVFCIPFSYWQVLIFDDQRWIFGSAMCSLLSFFQGIAVFLSSWTLVVISFDRWMAIMFVLSPSMRLTRKRATYLVFSTWAFSITMALPLFLVSKVQATGGIERCDEDWTAVEMFIPGSRRLYSYLVLVLQYVVPLTVLIITYTFIGMKMWNSRIPGPSSSTKKVVMERHESVKKLIPMVILISAMFAFCWLPLLLLINVVIDIWPSVASWKYILYIWWFSHGLAMMHSMVNPIVYFLRNARFREGFCYFSRFLPCVHFREFKLLSEQARRWFSHGLAMMHSMVNPIVYFLRNARFREGFCYFSRFLPCVHFREFKLLSEQARSTRDSYYPLSKVNFSVRSRSGTVNPGSLNSRCAPSEYGGFPSYARFSNQARPLIVRQTTVI